MIRVKLDDSGQKKIIGKISQAALVCYNPRIPRLGKEINIKGRLWDVSHHTTFQHAPSYFSFLIDGIAVGDVTLGMHLASPFYNTSQRSGRYCSRMFNKTGVKKIREYIQYFWPQLSEKKINGIIKYIESGMDIFSRNTSPATKVVARFLKEERSFITEKSVKMNAPKIAKEQLRMFIPVIFPTGLVHTLNLSALAAIYESAWTPAMKYTTQKMVTAVLKRNPKLSFIFNEERRRKDEWFLSLPSKDAIGVCYKPRLKLLNIADRENFVLPNHSTMHPLDKLHYDPELMDNNLGEIRMEVEISLAGMAQDQRHRIISRSKPRLTGNFYLPPLGHELGLEKEALALMDEWLRVAKNIPPTLAMILAPYGAMVKYRKRGSFNGVAHEQAKRLCWCAQEEIYHLSKNQRLEVKKRVGEESELIKIFEPPCYREGRCLEGSRYCGRDIKVRESGDYFPNRMV